jgi:isopropylmalate/homocitrate/citramalate synthase
VKLCDVTLREAPQMPGRAYDASSLVEAGEALDRLGVPRIQAGFPAIGRLDETVVRRCAASLDATVAALARARVDDVDAALDADAEAVDVFVPISDRHLEHVLGRSRQEAFDLAEGAVARAREGDAEVALTLMDAFRAEAGDVAAAFARFDCQVVLADTVGARTPAYVAGFLATLTESGVDLSRAGVHFHDDLGVATANALAAARLGVDRVDVSVASLGERAGNTALEELVVASAGLGGETGLDESRLVPACREVLDALGEEVSPRKAVLGGEPTTHESGLHTAAMLADPRVFEPFDPTTFGGRRRLVFGANTGREAAERLLERANREATEELVARLLERLDSDGPVDLEMALDIARTV